MCFITDKHTGNNIFVNIYDINELTAKSFEYCMDGCWNVHEEFLDTDIRQAKSNYMEMGTEVEQLLFNNVFKHA